MVDQIEENDNQFGNNQRRVKRVLLIRKDSAEDGMAMDGEGIGVKGDDAVRLSQLSEA